MFILSYEAGFYKPTILKVISRITAYATMPGRLELSINSFCSWLLIQMPEKWSPQWGFDPSTSQS